MLARLSTYGELPGAWRIEERPAAAQAEDYFANVLLLTGASSDERPQIELLANDAVALAFRARLDDGSAVSLRFAKGPKPSTTMKIERSGKVLFDAALPDRVVLEEGRP